MSSRKHKSGKLKWLLMFSFSFWVLSCRMSYRITTYSDMEIMENILNQDQKNVCWAISLTKQLVALLKLRGALDIDAQLSIQYLINKVGDLSMEYKIQGHAWDGSISSFETAVPFLLSGGSVLEHVVPLWFDLHSTTPENTLVGQQSYRAGSIIVHHMEDYEGIVIFWIFYIKKKLIPFFKLSIPYAPSVSEWSMF